MADQPARALRKRMTPQEVKLWLHLRSWRQRGFHFRRQAPRGPQGRFIVDFVCLKYRLIVEVDGGQHNFDAHARADAKRDRYFERGGFRVLRFWNSEVDQQLEGVLALIDEALQKPTHPAVLRTATLPLRGRDDIAWLYSAKLGSPRYTVFAGLFTCSFAKPAVEA